jgi:signal transduction histidine kinase
MSMLLPADESIDASRLAAERYALLVTNLPASAVMLFDHDLRFVLADGPELARNGHTKAKLEGRLLHDVLDPAFVAMVEPNLRAALSGHRFQAELPFGELVYLYTYEPLRDASGEVLYAMVLAQDITPLRQAEQRAVQSEARMREIVGNIEGSVFAIGADRRIRFTDGLALHRVGQRPGEVDGRLVDEVYAGRSDLLRLVDLALEGHHIATDVPLNDRIWEVRYSPIRDAQGVVTEVVGVAVDVTDRRRLEASHRQSQKLEALGRLAGGVAHDFNNMLAVITSAAEELRNALQDSRPDLLEVSNLVLGAAERAAQLTRQLLAFSRSRPLAAEAVAVDEAVRESVALLSRSLSRSVSIETALTATDAVVVVDAAQLQNALVNLGINAHDAMPSGGTLRFATAIVSVESGAPGPPEGLEPGRYVRISVTDTGHGIPPEHLGRVFDPFFTTKAVGKGTGLGLAVVYGTARAHGGGVTVESQPGRGSSFHLWLPLSDQQAAAATSPTGTLSTGHGLVLLVDDEPTVGLVGQRVLKSLGYETIVAHRGPEALVVFGQLHDRLAMVICDVLMPGLSGPDTLRQMRAVDPSVPVALCSGYPDEHVGPIQAEGVTDVLVKPYKREELASLLERRARTPPK